MDDDKLGLAQPALVLRRDRAIDGCVSLVIDAMNDGHSSRSLCTTGLERGTINSAITFPRPTVTMSLLASLFLELVSSG